MSSIKNVIIIGAGGNLGPSVLNAFLKHSSMAVTILSRLDSTSTFPSGIKVIRADYSNSDSLISAFRGQDAIVSLVTGSAIPEQVKYINAAIAAGVQRFVPSEYGIDTYNPRVLEEIPLLKSRNDVVDHLRSKKDQISWTVFVTGLFFDWGVLSGFLGYDAAKKTASIYDGGKATFAATNTATIGLAIVRALEKPDVSHNAKIYVSSFQTTQNDLLAEVEKVTAEKWLVTNVDAKEHIEAGRKRLSQGDFTGLFNVIQGVVYGKQQLGDHSKAGLWNEKLGLGADNFEESVKAGLAGKLTWQA